MHLTSHGLKGIDVDATIGRLTLISGPNATGKSTHADSLMYALLGYLPRLGRKEDLTAQLMRSDSMAVELALDDGRTIRRSLKLQADGKFRGSVECSWLGRAKAKAEEHDVAILRLLGAETQDAIEALDIRELLKLTGNQRLARIQALLEVDVDPAQLAAATARYTMQRLASVDDERMPEDHLSLRPLIPGYDSKGDAHVGQYALLREAMSMLAGKLAEVGLAGAAKWANDEKRLAGSGLRPAQQARERLATRVQELGDEQPEELGRLESERSALEQLLGAASQRRTGVANSRRLVADAASGLVVAQTTHTAAVSARDEFELHGQGELDKRRAELAGLEADTCLMPDPPDETDANNLDASASTMERDAAAIGVPHAPSVEGAELCVVHLTQRLAAAHASPWSKVIDIADRIADTVSGWEDSDGRRNRVQTLAAELIALAIDVGDGDVEAIERDLSAARVELRAAQELSDTVAGEARECVHRTQQLQGAAAALHGRAEQMRIQLRREYQSARVTATTRGETIRRSIQTARNAIAALDERDRRTAEAVRENARALQAAEQRVRDAGPPLAIEDEDSAIDARLGAVRSQIDALQAAATTRREFARLIAEIDAYRAKEVVYKALEWALIRVREDEVTHAGGPLVAHMHRMCLAAFGERAPAPYVQGGDLGWRTHDGTPVSVNVLSGSEYAVFLAALAAAILALRGAELRVLIVESSECDMAMLEAMLRGIGAVATDLTHAIVLTHHVPPPAAPGWDVMEMARTEGRAAA